MLKGHLEIELKNEKTGKTEHHSQDNLVTNATAYLLGITTQISGDVNSSNAVTNVVPIGKKALGGLFLFDGPLEEDVNNVHFPMNVHLTGHAGQSMNTSGKLKGSINSSESGITDTGYVNVWDFSTSQANGTIASLALTHANAGTNPMMKEQCFVSSFNLDKYYSPIAIDDKTGDVYFYLQGAIYKKHVLTPDIKTNTPYYGKEEKVSDLLIQNPVYNYWSICNGYDGYLYAIYIPNVKTKGTVTVRIKRFKMSDWSFEEDEKEIVFSISNITAQQTYDTSNGLSMPACVSKGYFYFLSYDYSTVYQVDLENTVDVKERTFDENYVSKVFPKYNGGIYAYFYHDGKTETGSTRRYYSPGFIYEDGKYRLDDEAKLTSDSSSNNYTGYESERLFRLQVPSSYAYPGFTLAYLGTICNLSSPVVKTSAQSMKVTYTLTDI